jgi:hypothetical protein
VGDSDSEKLLRRKGLSALAGFSGFYRLIFSGHREKGVSKFSYLLLSLI